MTAPPRTRSAKLPRSLTVAAAVVILPGLAAVLSLALTMLTRMMVEREREPDLHLPTFWVWMGLNMIWVVWMIVQEIRGPAGSATGASAPTGLPDDARVSLVFGQPGDVPVASLAYTPPWAESAEIADLPVTELTPADVALLEQITDGSMGLAGVHGEQHDLSESGIRLLTASSGTLRTALSDLIARAEAADLQEFDGGAGDDDSSPAQDEPVAQAVTVAQAGTGLRIARRVTTVLWVVFALVVVAALGWRALVDMGALSDVEDDTLWLSMALATILIGPFVIWGWYGVVSYLTMRDARQLDPQVARRARSDFWMFGGCSAWIMVFLGGLTVMALWISEDGFLAPLMGLGVVLVFAVIGSLSLGRAGFGRVDSQ